MHIHVDKKERDGIFETEECFNFLEATMDSKKSKAEQDANKLAELLCKYKTSDKPAVGWFVTYKEPTADQRDAIKKICTKKSVKIRAVSFNQFQALLIDVNEYLSLREKHRFGSIHNPNTGMYDNDLVYIDNIACENRTSILSADDIATGLEEGERIEITGDYGAGKSMTLRAVYRKLCSSFYLKKTFKFPVYINLREHQKQDDVADILMIHGKLIGMKYPHHLIRAWRAGYIHLILDGFDELMSVGIQNKRKKLRDIRFSILKPIREFIRMHPSDSGIAIAGRAHYFDGVKEKENAMDTARFRHIILNDFSEDQIKEFLSVNDIDIPIPSWLPSRPLLLGTLILQECLNRTDPTEIADPAVGWELLLSEIAKREAGIEAGLDGDAIRAILEQLAIYAKSTSSGIGPLTHNLICEAFERECGYAPDDDAMTILLRLPGLGYDAAEESSRCFIDNDFVDICGASYICKYIASPYSYLDSALKNIQHCLLDTGIAFASTKITSLTEKHILSTIKHASDMLRNDYLANDIINICLESGKKIEDTVNIVGIGGHLNIDKNTDMSKITYSDCVFEHAEFPSDFILDKLPHFKGCIFGMITGISSTTDLPMHILDEKCEVDLFSDAYTTTDDIFDSSLDTSIKVLMSILKKLYVQRGSGRLESALLRGLDQNSKRFVPDVLRILQTEGLAIKLARSGKELWLADKKHFSRVAHILSSPATSLDPLLDKVKRNA